MRCCRQCENRSRKCDATNAEDDGGKSKEEVDAGDGDDGAEEDKLGEGKESVVALGSLREQSGTCRLQLLAG